MQTGTQLTLFAPNDPDTQLGVHFSAKVQPLEDQRAGGERRDESAENWADADAARHKDLSIQ